MKAILEFDLDDHDDANAHKRAISATNAYLVLFDLDNYLRSELKYKELSEEVGLAIQNMRDKLHNLTEEHRINMSDLE